MIVYETFMSAENIAMLFFQWSCCEGLIDVSSCFSKLRKNLGNKNCEFKPEHIQLIQDAYNHFTEIKKEEDEGL